MSVTIVNTSGRKQLLRFNSGNSVYIGPGEVLKNVEPVEIKGNAWIIELERNRTLSLDPPLSGKGKPRVRSKDMKAEEAIKLIREARAEDLEDFTAGDDRVTVLRAVADRLGE